MVSLKKLFLILLVPFLLSACSSSAVNTQETSQSQQQDNTTFTLISTGDIGLVRDVNNQVQIRKDPVYPFANIKHYLSSADLTITNLEGPLIKNCPIILSGFKFCGEATNVEGMKAAGIDAANLANNHTTNYGQEGLQETKEILENSQIIPFGLDNEIKYIDVKGKKVALVGFVELGVNWPGLSNATPQNVEKLTKEAKQNADIVIASFHWGAEYVRRPSPDLVKLAHLTVDSGADLVLGNHAHWIQTNEIYKDVFITYAQGNTIFDQDWSQETKEGVLYKFIYKDGKFQKVEDKYTIIENNSQPRFATDEETAKILAKFN